MTKKVSKMTPEQLEAEIKATTRANRALFTTEKPSSSPEEPRREPDYDTLVGKKRTYKYLRHT
jgi:hypothetical protein|tara:strand:+ start:320 stop:508 length:189 start_codon:yes stop_codon:yes gene_type:complete